MFSAERNTQSVVRDFRIDNMMRYSLFVPRLYNLCLSLGFEANNIMPSRAFCSDENQGFPIILITKHFGAFPFNHGRVGGVVATDLHAPHAHHGKDMVIIQASHVGYDPDEKIFGAYRRLQTPGNKKTDTCGKAGEITRWYQDEYRFVQNNIYLENKSGLRTVTIDNHLLDERREEGLFLDLDTMIKKENDRWKLLHTLSTSRAYEASNKLADYFPDDIFNSNQRLSIGSYLGPEIFGFKKRIDNALSQNHLEANLLDAMPWIVTSSEPLLVAAKVNTQVEFDRTYRTIVKEKEYQNKNLLFISCLNIDISPVEGQMFPLTKCVPWAAYIQSVDGSARTLEQKELTDLLMQQSTENPAQIDLESAIQQMVVAPEIKIDC